MATYIKGNTVENATSYELLEKKSDGTYNSLEEKSSINFTLEEYDLDAGSHTLVVRAKADGYADSEDSNEVTYTVAADATSLTLEAYSSDGVATAALLDDDLVITGTAGTSCVVMAATNSNYSFTAPYDCRTDGRYMIVIGSYDGCILAIRPRGGSVAGTALQKYNYTSFSGGALSTADDAANATYEAGDTLAVVWSGDTAALYVNGTLQSSFDCSAYTSQTSWKKCAGIAFTALDADTVTLADFALG